MNKTQENALSTMPQDPSNTGKRRPRNPLSCENCRFSKLRCDRTQPCSTCRRRRLVASCVYRDRRGSVTSPTARITVGPHVSPSQPHGGKSVAPQSSLPPVDVIGELSTDDSPSHISTHSHWEAVLQRPMVDQSNVLRGYESQSFLFSQGPRVSRQELLEQLPPEHCCDYLLSQYFMHIAPLFHILHGPTFQEEYAVFMEEPSENLNLSWIALLFAILALTLSTLDPDDPVVTEIWRKKQQPPSHIHTTAALSSHFQSLAMTCLAQEQFLVRHCLATLAALLISIYTICHNEGAERAWILLGIALNMGIALRCNMDLPNLNCLETERRRRCWAGIMLLHTYQAISFRDIDLLLLVKANQTMPANVNDIDISEDQIKPSSSQPTQMAVTTYKINLFHLSARVCLHISGPSRLEKTSLHCLDTAIANHQQQWSSTFLAKGRPSILNVDDYAYWCVLETYAHQLYLLIHRPFCNSNSSHFLPASRDRCIASSLALLDIHRQFCELSRLRHFKWLVHGIVSFNTLHGAVALVSCLLDRSDPQEIAKYRLAYEATVLHLETLQNRSPVCAKAFSILRHLQFVDGNQAPTI